MYQVYYEVEYRNNTDADIVLSQGIFGHPTSRDTPLSSSSFDKVFTLDKNSSGSITVMWVHTWAFFVRDDECMKRRERGDFINSFYLQLDSGDYRRVIAGWPEDRHNLENAVSYGNGFGFGYVQIGIVRDGEPQAFDFANDGYRKDHPIGIDARLTIDGSDDISFEVTILPHRFVFPEGWPLRLRRSGSGV